MPLITNGWQVLFLVWMLFQWELDESIHLHILLILVFVYVSGWPNRPLGGICTNIV
ncbi:30S ribosomal protein s7 chloroplastic [Phtheirospermum japonicum]|uniref:30S ribosomal protein s7 chloroplastic n=1 Tax=Phtheirospermum japonicum TaxID=374723 RepID=A0A830BM84_9LAMI|nr:30S ribosomal protein s7 chloroplastic [Phtheirospermum japonicum]